MGAGQVAGEGVAVRAWVGEARVVEVGVQGERAAGA